MDPQSPKSTTKEEKDIDLGVLFSLLGRMTRRIFSAIGALFVFLFEALITLLLFIKRKFIYLLIAAVIGLAIGFFLYTRVGEIYKSNMIVRTNFESSRSLYNKIDYFNAMIKQGRSKELASIFSIPEQDARAIRSFKISPIDNELERARIYRENFFSYNRSAMLSLDTMWSKSIKYKEFKEDLTKYDYPFHEIELYSTSPTINRSIGKGIVNAVNDNQILKTVKQGTDSLLKGEERIITSSLESLDSLKKAYNRRIENSSAPGKGEGQNFIFSDRDMRNPEIDLYDKELVLKDELTKIKRRQLDQIDIIQIYSDFNEVGTPASIYKKPYVLFPLFAMAAVFVILVFIELIRSLNVIERNRKAGK